MVLWNALPKSLDLVVLLNTLKDRVTARLVPFTDL